MLIPRVFYPDELEVGSLVELDPKACHHLLNVLRLSENASVTVFNGQGGEYLAQLKPQKKRASLLLERFCDVNKESSLSVHLGQALVRGDRMDWVIQKSTELGVKSITPLLTKKGIAKLSKDKLLSRMHHWENIAISATEQCGRTILPRIHPPITLSAWCEQPLEGHALFLDPNASQRLTSLTPTKNITLSIGPESGWDEHEIELMERIGWQSTSLGPRILRTETAPLAAISILQSTLGDL